MKTQDAAPLALIAALAAGATPAMAEDNTMGGNMNILIQNTRTLMELAGTTASGQARYRKVDGESPKTISDTYFLGVDVGYSARRASLGYCVLRVSGGVVEVAQNAGGLPGHGLATLADFKAIILPRLLQWRRDDPFKSIILDGPLTPEWNANGSPWYRPQEQLLAGGAFPRKVKAQPYNSPVGKNLYRATMDLRYICEKSGYKYEPYSGVSAGREGLVLESFPKLWLAMMFDWGYLDRIIEASEAKRSHVDHQLALWLLTGSAPAEVKARSVDFHSYIKSLGFTMPVELPAIRSTLADKDVTAALVSALSGLMAYLGHAGVLGNEEYGSFLVLPH